MATPYAQDGDAAGTFLGHPKGLFVLFFAEMWERFSFYGMRALLIFYLTQHWLFSDGKSNLIYGAYTALVYITPVLGGYLADRYLGQRKAVLLGGVLLAFGHLFMAFEGDHGITDAATKQADPAINISWKICKGGFSDTVLALGFGLGLPSCFIHSFALTRCRWRNIDTPRARLTWS